MVTTITKHVCGLCGFTTADLAAAEACEAQGMPEAVLAVGDFIGLQPHGWWKADKTWTLAQPQRPGDRHGPPTTEPNGWGLPELAPAGELRPGLWWFLPIYRVVAVAPYVRSGMQGTSNLGYHAWKYVVWTPRHANCSRGSEKVCWTAVYGNLVRVTPAGQPVLTAEEEARYRALVEGFERNPALAEGVSLL